MMDKYVLDGKTPVIEPDIMKWARAFELENRVVAQTDIGDFRVSTVFLAMDHRFMNNGPPILFETMVFGPDDHELSDSQRRYATWDEAEAGHEEFVRRAKRAAKTTL